MTIGEQLRDARVRAGLTQEDLAVAIGRGRTTVYAWESDRTPIPDIMLARVRDYLGVDADFNPVSPTTQTVTLEEFSDAELVSHMHVVATEVARRLGTTSVTVEPGAAADIERSPGSVRIQTGVRQQRGSIRRTGDDRTR